MRIGQIVLGCGIALSLLACESKQTKLPLPESGKLELTDEEVYVVSGYLPAEAGGEPVKLEKAQVSCSNEVVCQSKAQMRKERGKEDHQWFYVLARKPGESDVTYRYEHPKTKKMVEQTIHLKVDKARYDKMHVGAPALPKSERVQLMQLRQPLTSFSALCDRIKEEKYNNQSDRKVMAYRCEEKWPMYRLGEMFVICPGEDCPEPKRFEACLDWDDGRVTGISFYKEDKQISSQGVHQEGNCGLIGGDKEAAEAPEEKEASAKAEGK